MNKPVLFGETINKKTVSRNKTTIPYERGMLSQEDRVFVESVVDDIKHSKVQTGYDGNIVRKEVIDFEAEFPGLIFKKVDFLYDRMMKDARNVFPRNRELKNKVAIYYEEMIRRNLNNLYHHAPKFFADNFVTKNYINNGAFEAYQVYIFLLCFIHWTDEHRLDTDVREFDNIDKILNWISTRRDPSIEYIINGPNGNSDLSLTDFRAHYRTLIDTSNEMSEIISYNQLSSTQTISSDLYNLLHIIQSLPNVYFKTPDEARKYNINIDSAKDVLVSIDNDNNLVFDCSYVNLGDVTEQNKLAKFDNLESVITNNKVNSMINTKKLAELFHNYSRIKILELVMTPDTYISSLDAFNKVFVVFKGVSCSERNVYNTIPTNYLKIGGKFIKTKRGYEFQMDVDAITYKSVLADVKSFEIYLTLDPNYANQIIPNEYALTFSKHKIFQHPITTDVVYDSKIRGVRKILTVRTIKPNGKNDDNSQLDGKSKSADKSAIDICNILGLKFEDQRVSLVVNNRWSPNNVLRNRLPIHASTNDPILDAFILGTDHKNVKQSLVNVLVEKTKKSTNSKESIIHSIDECLDVANRCRNDVRDANPYYSHFLLRVIKILNEIRDSWTYDEKLTKLSLLLTTSSHLDKDTIALLSKGISASTFVRVPSKDSVLEPILDSYPAWTAMKDVYDNITSEDLEQPDYDRMIPVINQVLSLDHSDDLDIRSKLLLENRVNDGTDLTDEDKTLIRNKTKDLMLAIGNKTELSNAIDQREISDDDINKLVNAVNRYNSLDSESLFAITSALQQFIYQTSSNDDRILAKRAAEKIYYSNSLTDEEKAIATKAVNQYINISDSVKSSILSHIDSETQLSRAEQTTLKILVNRSLALTNDEKQKITNNANDPESLKTDRNVIKTAFDNDIVMNDVYKSQLSTYNKPLTSEADTDQLISEIKGYRDPGVLNDDIESGSLTPEEIDQLIATMTAYYDSLEHNINFSPMPFITFIDELDNSQYYDIVDEMKYYYDPNVNDDVFTDFFAGISSDLIMYCSDTPAFILAYENIRTNKAIIMHHYLQYFDDVFNALTENDTTDTVEDALALFKIFKSVYQWLFAQLLITVDTSDQKIDYEYRNVEVDLSNSTIEGHYFTVDTNGFATLDDSAGPNPDYLIYSEEENDLTLFNLYTKYNVDLDPVIFGTFIYSESLKTIQNLNYPLYDYTGYQNRIKFDNNYNSASDPHLDESNIYYKFYNTGIGFKSEGTAAKLEAEMKSSSQNTDTVYWTSDDSTTITVTPNNANQIQTDLTSFAGQCTIAITSGSNTTEVVADCVFVKNSSVTAVTPEEEEETTDTNNDNNGTGTGGNSGDSSATTPTTVNYYLVGIIRSVTSDAIHLDVTENMLIHANVEITDDSTNSSESFPATEAYIEPACIGSIGDTIINDTFNNTTTVSEYFDVSFDNTIGFTNLTELVDLGDKAYEEAIRGEYTYRVDYIYDRNEACLEIKNTISKAAVNDVYIESILIYFNNKMILRKLIVQDSQTDEIKSSTFDLLSVRDPADSTSTYVDTYRFGEVVKYSDKDVLKGNEYKAFYIDGIDAKRQYWNKTSYINSLMLCPASTCDSTLYPESDYEPFTDELVINGQTESTTIYNYTNGFTVYNDKFKICNDGIYIADENNNYVKSSIYNLFVNNNDKLVCSTELDETYKADNDVVKKITVSLYKDSSKAYFQITLSIQNAMIVGFSLRTINKPYMDDEDVDFGDYQYPPVSEQPVYLYNGNNAVEVIISYENSFSDFPNQKSMTIKTISVTTIRYKTTHYVYDTDTHTVSYRDVQTLRYSNIPGDYCDTSDVLFALVGQEGMIFKFNPIFKYYENIIVSPRHVDENNNFIMVAQKYNQNVLGKPVYLRSQYNLNNPTVNTLRDSDTIEYKIAQTLDPNKTHLMESVNKQMLMFGGVENYGPIASVAIKSAKVHAIPTASKMLLSLEFS